MINVLIADDHPIVRTGLKKILIDQMKISNIGEAANAKEVFAQIKNKKWDVLVLDISMPDFNGLEILKRVKKNYPDIPVLILSVHSEEQYAVRVLKAGASGYLTKETAPEELVKAIKIVVAGRKYVNPTLAEKLAFYIERGDTSLHGQLSHREFEVMCMIASGNTVKEIAQKLYLSVKTVSTYRSRILDKMNMKTNSELTYYAVKNNLID